MNSNKTPSDIDRPGQSGAEARRNQVRRDKTIRERALKLFPWVCARCGREFTGKKLRELTVHHKDHNHDNNPPDGSNWELLCIYCHENEHARYSDTQWVEEPTPDEKHDASTTHKPFAGLDKLLKDKKE
ncbi:MAG: HNH nuclease family protein [Deltaproteobacteria bacterium]|nr:HNH nuclease family protein [Deltaproteobacteria bacterium]